MQVKVFGDKHALSRAAADHAAKSLRAVIRDQGAARIVAATGASQFEFLEALTSAPEIDWRRVESSSFTWTNTLACRSHIRRVFASTSSNG